MDEDASWGLNALLHAAYDAEDFLLCRAPAFFTHGPRL